MKTDNPEKGSVYQGNREKAGPKLALHLPLLLAALITAHFLNLFLQWSVIRRELAQKPSFRSPEYTFIGFAPFHSGEIKAAQRLPNAAPAGRVFAFFDLLHPAVFMVWNNGEAEDFFDLGPLLVAVPAGASRVTFFPGAVFLLRQGERSVARNFGGSILGRFWTRSLNEKGIGPGMNNNKPPGSFVVKPAEGSVSQRIPYLIYFYLPLALIAVAIALRGAGMAAAFFYYAGMFFLFDFEKLLVSVPLAWLFNALGVELPDPWIKVLGVAMTLLFLAAAVFGLWRWRNREMCRRDKWIVCFFILLPFFLFF